MNEKDKFTKEAIERLKADILLLNVFIYGILSMGLITLIVYLVGTYLM